MEILKLKEIKAYSNNNKTFCDYVSIWSNISHIFLIRCEIIDFEPNCKYIYASGSLFEHTIIS